MKPVQSTSRWVIADDCVEKCAEHAANVWTDYLESDMNQAYSSQRPNWRSAICRDLRTRRNSEKVLNPAFVHWVARATTDDDTDNEGEERGAKGARVRV